MEYSNNTQDPICSINIEKIDIFNELWNINLKTSPGTNNILAIFLNGKPHSYPTFIQKIRTSVLNYHSI